MHIDPNDITATCYHGDMQNERYYIKISFPNPIKMHINSFVLQPSKFEDQPIWLQPPKHRQGSRWVGTVDIEKSSELWPIIEQKAQEAVEVYKLEHGQPKPKRPKDIVVEDIPDRPLTVDDFADIPF